MGESTNAIRKELNHLQDAGYLEKLKVNNKVEYKANTEHPLFEVLRKVVLKHLGLEDVVEKVLEKMGNVDQIILVGDYAKGNDSGLIEVFLIGNGPSLNKTPLYLIKDEYIMCFIRFHLMYERLNWRPIFYTIVDNLLLKDVANEFHKIEPHSKYIFLPKIHPVGDKVFKIFNIKEKKR